MATDESRQETTRDTVRRVDTAEVTEDPNVSAAIKESLAAVERSREIARRDHEETERLGRETRAILTRLLAA